MREVLFLSHEGAETQCPGSDVSARSGVVLILNWVWRLGFERIKQEETITYLKHREFFCYYLNSVVQVYTLDFVHGNAQCCVARSKWHHASTYHTVCPQRWLDPIRYIMTTVLSPPLPICPSSHHQRCPFLWPHKSCSESHSVFVSQSWWTGFEDKKGHVTSGTRTETQRGFNQPLKPEETLDVCFSDSSHISAEIAMPIGGNHPGPVPWKDAGDAVCLTCLRTHDACPTPFSQTHTHTHSRTCVRVHAKQWLSLTLWWLYSTDFVSASQARPSSVLVKIPWCRHSKNPRPRGETQTAHRHGSWNRPLSQGRWRMPSFPYLDYSLFLPPSLWWRLAMLPRLALISPCLRCRSSWTDKHTSPHLATVVCDSRVPNLS